MKSAPESVRSPRQDLPTRTANPFRINTYATVHSKLLTAKLNPLDATLTKNPGGGGVAFDFPFSILSFGKPFCLIPQAQGLRPKTLLVLLPRSFEVIRFLLLALDCSFGGVLLIHFHDVRKSRVSLRSGLFGIDDQLKTIGERRSHEIQRILRVFPEGDRLLSKFIF